MTTAGVPERPGTQTAAPGRPAVRSLLLGMAGRIADGPPAAMRSLLADDQLGDGTRGRRRGSAYRGPGVRLRC